MSAAAPVGDYPMVKPPILAIRLLTSGWRSDAILALESGVISVLVIGESFLGTFRLKYVGKLS